MDRHDFRAWRERCGLSQIDVANRYGLSRNTINNWETGATPLPQTVEGACTVWEDRLKKEQAARGPVTLCYADGPMFVDPYRPRRRMAQLQQEPYPTNAAALARVQLLWGREDFHGPFIMEKSGASLWNQVELMRVVDGSDKTAPTMANTIRRVAAYVRTNAQVYVRDGAVRPSTQDHQKTVDAIRGVAAQLDALADQVPVHDDQFQSLLSRLHDLGFFPPNQFVSDVAHAAHGNEMAAQQQY